MRYVRNTRKTYSTKAVSVGSGPAKMMPWMCSISANTRAGSMVANDALYGTYGFGGTAVSTQATTRNSESKRTYAHLSGEGKGLATNVRPLRRYPYMVLLSRFTTSSPREMRSMMTDAFPLGENGVNMER